MRDGLSLLDQAIAHGEKATITADTVRDMLGLADRGRVFDLFETVMGGKIAEALTDLSDLYDHGADPLAVMQDLLEIAHFLTRVKVAPGAEGFFDGGSGEAKRAAEMAAKLSVPALTRAWQMLLKGLFEVRDATRPIAACEMALIRLAYAADLPPTDKLVRDLMDGGARRARNPAVTPAPARATCCARCADGARGRAFSAHRSRRMSAVPHTMIRSLEDIAALAQANGAPVLKVHIENDIHLVRLEPGQIEFRPSPRAPRTLAGDLAQKLKDWTGMRWVVSIAREGGAPTLAEQKKSAKAAKFESVTQEPMVRAVLDRFPGAEIIAVRDIAEEDEIAAAIPKQRANEHGRHVFPLPLSGAKIRRRPGRGCAIRASCPPPSALAARHLPRIREGKITDGLLSAGPEIERLIQLLAKLPGLGPRSARRAALALLKKRDTLLEPLVRRHARAADAITTCEICGNLDTATPCAHLPRSAPRSRMCCASWRMSPICGRWSGPAFSAAAIMCWAARCRRWMA